MDSVCKELDEVKAELEKLRGEYKIKAELSESLRRAHTDQLAKSQEAKLQIEKQAKDLNVKLDEMAELRQLYEEVQSKLQKTESSLKQVTSMNEKIRVDSGEKVQRLEEENRKLVSALEEVTGRNDDLELKLHTCSEEIGGLKRLLSESQRKCLEAEEKVRAGKELRHREEVISELEEKSKSVQDQLKWKKEQFQHLEEAHKLLQSQFQSSKEEWAAEKSSLWEEMTTLQSKLDSQIRITESLESRLKMCNQALAHEESRRKLLEIQLSESKQCFENVLAEYEEAKGKIESLSNKRDEDIAGLRNSLGMKEIMLKESEYRVTHLEQENKELLGTVKELQEAQINKRKVDPSATKLRNKLKDLEQLHSKCSLTLKEREAEWNSKMEKLIGDMRCYESDLKRQSEQINQLKTQLENCHTAMEVSVEETSILFMVLKSELSDAYLKLFNSETQVEVFSKHRGEKIPVSAENLETGNCSPSNTQVSLKQARMEITSLTHKLESLKFLEERSTILETALEEHKKMLEESSGCQLRLKEQVDQLDIDVRNVSTALENSKFELSAKTSEARQTDAELQLWKSKAESFRTCLEQSQEVCQKMETSLLEQLETEQGLRKENDTFQCRLKEQEESIEDLQKEIASLAQLLEENEAALETLELKLAEAHRKEDHFLQIMTERDTFFESLRKELKAMEEQSIRSASLAAESARQEAVTIFEHEKEELYRIIKEKDATVEHLSDELEAMEAKSVRMASAAAESASLEADSKFRREKEELCRIIKERDEAVDNLQKELDAVKEESTRALTGVESARLEAEIKFEHEKEELRRIITTEKDETIRCLRDFASSLEQNVINVALVSLSQSIEDQVKISALQEALEKSTLCMNAEMKRKNNAIDVLELEVNNLRDEMLLKEESLHHSIQSVEELEALAEVKKLETERLFKQFKEEQTKLKELVKGLEREKEAASNNIKRLSSERNNLLLYVEGICEQFGDFCMQDAKLEGMLSKLIQSSDSTLDGHKVRDPVHKDVKKEIEPSPDRSPLRERNHQ